MTLFDVRAPLDPYPDLDERAILPFGRSLGIRGSIVTFDVEFETTAGLEEDAARLTNTELGSVPFGAMDLPIRPFLAPLDIGRPTPTSALEILRSIQAAHFNSQHIASLDVPELPYAGYNPGSRNDEIHTDHVHSHLFDKNDPASSAVQQSLRDAVVDQKLWHILLHTAAESYTPDGIPEASYVILLAIGRSKRGKHLLGLIGCQSCHNFCD